MKVVPGKLLAEVAEVRMGSGGALGVERHGRRGWGCDGRRGGGWGRNRCNDDIVELVVELTRTCASVRRGFSFEHEWGSARVSRY